MPWPKFFCGCGCEISAEQSSTKEQKVSASAVVVPDPVSIEEGQLRTFVSEDPKNGSLSSVPSLGSDLPSHAEEDDEEEKRNRHHRRVSGFSPLIRRIIKEQTAIQSRIPGWSGFDNLGSVPTNEEVVNMVSGDDHRLVKRRTVSY